MTDDPTSGLIEAATSALEERIRTERLFQKTKKFRAHYCGGNIREVPAHAVNTAYLALRQKFFPHYVELNGHEAPFRTIDVYLDLHHSAIFGVALLDWYFADEDDAFFFKMKYG